MPLWFNLFTSLTDQSVIPITVAVCRKPSPPRTARSGCIRQSSFLQRLSYQHRSPGDVYKDHIIENLCLSIEYAANRVKSGGMIIQLGGFLYIRNVFHIIICESKTGWWIDQLRINWQCVDMPGNSGKAEIDALPKETLESIIMYNNAAGGLTATAKGAIPAMPDGTQIIQCILKTPFRC